MQDYKAKPLSRKKIRGAAHQIREILGIKDQVCIDVIKLLEQILPMIFEDEFNYEIVEDNEIGVMALTTPNEGKILIRNSVYEGAVNGNGRDRFTIMHEIAHLFLHRGMTVRLARRGEEIEIFEDPEWQADAFAGEFLIDCDVVKDMSPYEIAQKCKVSEAAAKCQYKQFHQKKIG